MPCTLQKLIVINYYWWMREEILKWFLRLKEGAYLHTQSFWVNVLIPYQCGTHHGFMCELHSRPKCTHCRDKHLSVIIDWSIEYDRGKLSQLLDCLNAYYIIYNKIMWSQIIKQECFLWQCLILITQNTLMKFKTWQGLI